MRYHRARWFDAYLGQWLSEDPIGFAAGDENLRRYVGNGTTNATDPSGLRKATRDEKRKMRQLLREGKHEQYAAYRERFPEAASQIEAAALSQDPAAHQRELNKNIIRSGQLSDATLHFALAHPELWKVFVTKYGFDGVARFEAATRKQWVFLPAGRYLWGKAWRDTSLPVDASVMRFVVKHYSFPTQDGVHLIPQPPSGWVCVSLELQAENLMTAVRLVDIDLVEDVPVLRAGDQETWSGDSVREALKKARVKIDDFFEQVARYVAEEVALHSAGMAGGKFLFASLDDVADAGKNLRRGCAPNSGLSQLVHLTDDAGQIGIAKTKTINGSHGIFAVPAHVAQESTALKVLRTGLTRDKTKNAVRVPKETLELFKRPVPIGPYSGWKFFGGVRYAPAGSISTTTGALSKTSTLVGPKVLIYGPDGVFHVGIATAGGLYIYGQTGGGQ